jgi:DNA-binding CsgD family transcriptional regulator
MEMSPEPSIPNSIGFPTEYLFSAFSKYKIGIAVVDRRLRFNTINRTLAEMNNLPLEAHLGKPLREVLGPLFIKVEPLLEQVFTTGQPLPSVELSGKLPTRPDPVQWLQFFFPLVDNCGRVTEIGAFVIERKSSSTLQISFDPALSPENGAGHMDHSELADAYRTGALLSGREREVLRLLATGKSNKEISSALTISVKTVETYRSRVMLKIHAPSLIHLVHYAIRHQIVELQG